MSDPPLQPENAAPVAPVSPARPAKSSPGPDAPPPPYAPASPRAVAALARVPGLPPHDEEVSTPSSLTSPSLQDSPSIPSNAGQNTWSRGPIPQPRPTGPSLLTQALTTARAAPHGQAELPDSESTTPRRVESDTTLIEAPRNAHDASPYHSDGEALTPRGSPRAATVSPSASTPRDRLRQESSETPAQKMMDIREVSSMLRGHRQFLDQSIGRGKSLERSDTFVREQEPLLRSQSFGVGAEDPGIGNGPHGSNAPASMHRTVTFNAGNSQDPAAQHRPRKLDHRVSIGPEKAWSIGTGELRNSQDGQVEKSITEVLAGVEPNTRSRKASHSLRFFKEGLPEEKTRRKDTRAGHPRESPASERPGDGIYVPGGGNDLASSDGQASPQPVEGVSQGSVYLRGARSSGLHSPKAPPIAESPEDYFLLRQNTESNTTVDQHELPHRAKALESNIREAQLQQSAPDDEDLTDNGQERRRKSDDTTEVGESAEDADDSSEEKISSAVFLPHQGLDEPPEITASGPKGPPRLAPGSRTLSRSDDFHPWLVKAGEPEVDEQRTENHDHDKLDRPSYEPPGPPVKEATSRISDAPAIVDEPEAGTYSLQPSRTITQYPDEHVHEHQLTPKQPLDAIELIPYKHQVGGHTTLWRFSKRAVCKQLNNRENEFYERIERYHRDLLPFLPRYIGVLNVTFQKRVRRKSTLRRDDCAAQDRKQLDQNGTSSALITDRSPPDDAVQAPVGLPPAENGQHRVISQSLQSTHIPVPTVTFVDNQHILPRNLLQPAQPGSNILGRFKSAPASVQGGQSSSGVSYVSAKKGSPLRPSLEDRHANSWGATTVNKRLRNEVFNDAFLKQPITVHKHRRGHQRAMARRTIQQTLRTTASDSLLNVTQETPDTSEHQAEAPYQRKESRLGQSQSDVGQQSRCSELRDEPEVKDVTGTSAPEPEIVVATPPQRRKRRHSGSALRRKPKDVRDARGDLVYFEEADEVGFKGDDGDRTAQLPQECSPEPAIFSTNGGLHNYGTADATPSLSTLTSAANSGPPSPTADLEKIPRPVNPKEAQTQRDSRVEYFLLLEDLTAGMKRPCIMDLKMGTRQYGVEANPKKQKSQQGKCAKTTSRELGVRVCGLQVWDMETQSYVFKDKYFGRDLKAGQEFQDTLTRFLYDGVDPSSILRHIPTVLQKLSQLEAIIRRLRGYRFYAASLLMFYDGDTSGDEYDTAVDDSSTDFGTDTEEYHRRPRENRREIDFKMADFANSVTAGDLARDKPCPPQHPDEPDRGFLRGLRSLRKYFLKIQQDTRAGMGLITRLRDGMPEDIDLEESEDEGSVSE